MNKQTRKYVQVSTLLRRKARDKSAELIPHLPFIVYDRNAQNRLPPSVIKFLKQS